MIDHGILQEFEQMRRQSLKRSYITFAVAAIVAIIVIAIDPALFMFALIGGLIIAIIGMAFFTRGYRKTFKTKILVPAVSKLYPKLTYSPTMGISQSEFRYTGIEQTHDRYRCEDLIMGEIDGVKLKVSDVHVEKREVHYHDGKRQERWVTTFKGRFCILDFNKSFEGLIQVIESMRFGRKMTDLFKTKQELVEMESEAFNKKFATYSTDAHTAFYVITPQMQEKLLELEKMHKGTIKFGFKNGEVHIAINDKSNSMEPSIFRPITEQSIEALLGSVHIIQEYIKMLRLNHKIFK